MLFLTPPKGSWRQAEVFPAPVLPARSPARADAGLARLPRVAGCLHAAAEARSERSQPPAALARQLSLRPPASESQCSVLAARERAGGAPSARLQGLRAEKPPSRQLEIVSKDTFLDKPGLRMSLSGWKSLRTLLCFVGSVPAVSAGTEGADLAAPCGGVSFSPVHPYVSCSSGYLQSLLPPQNRAFSLHLAEWRHEKTLGYWGCVILTGASGTLLMGVCCLVALGVGCRIAE